MMTSLYLVEHTSFINVLGYFICTKLQFNNVKKANLNYRQHIKSVYLKSQSHSHNSFRNNDATEIRSCIKEKVRQ